MNAPLRYLLITIEDHTKWVEKGAQGEPKCIDKTRVFDLPGTTLEHVYPRSASAAERKADLEEVKQSLGNLTILGTGENDKLANKSFGIASGS
ncbi:MAG: HNH endonuclease [Gammaproteobacteria bacterium]|nr:HNH endonuclease [Gammaproteobacteria bacterium]